MNLTSYHCSIPQVCECRRNHTTDPEKRKGKNGIAVDEGV